MAIWQSIVKMTLTSLLSGLTVVTIAALLNLRFTGKSLYEILLSRKKIILFFLVLSILLMPVVFSLPRGTLLSPKVLAVYVRELLVSVIIVVWFVVSFSVTREVLNDPASILRQLEALYTVYKRAAAFAWSCAWQVRILFLVTYPSRRGDIRLNDALSAFDHGDIAPVIVEELSQLRSLDKWIQQGENSGWVELEEYVEFGRGLHPVVRLAARVRLRSLRQEKHRKGIVRFERDKPDYEERLEYLLSSS